ncbi:hypothetical protein T492DRAFT_345713 [Pavlovales sp. CCMP2436]|nr:hypothetical protein T492DRAFT_345713 [Pavlovales sp. CCMP2436]
MDNFEVELDMYQEADMDGNGIVSEDELRFFMYNKRQQGAVSPEFKKTAVQLMRHYDVDGKGFLSKAEFSKLCSAMFESLEKVRPPTTLELLMKLNSVEAQLAQVTTFQSFF